MDAGDGSAQNPAEGLELIEITPGVSVDGSFLGKGAIGIPIGGKGEFAFGDGEMRADTKLDDVDVMYQGELSGNVSLTGGLELKILNCNIIDCSYTMTLAATLEVRDDGDGYCQGIDVVYSDEFKANTFTRVVGLLGTETLILLIDTVLSIVYDDGVGSWARDKLREFRDMLANGMGFGGPRLEAPIARWHWEGKDFASRRRTPNEVCSREFTLELISPTVLDVGESGALSIVAKPHASTAVTARKHARIEDQVVPKRVAVRPARPVIPVAVHGVRRAIGNPAPGRRQKPGRVGISCGTP